MYGRLPGRNTRLHELDRVWVYRIAPVIEEGPKRVFALPTPVQISCVRYQLDRRAAWLG